MIFSARQRLDAANPRRPMPSLACATERPTKRTTPPPRSKCSRGWSLSAGGPGMYVGGTDSNALHHLFAEVIDNSMDEAVAGHATFIEVSLEDSGYLTVVDNGRGMPVDPHPKFPKKVSARSHHDDAARGRQIRQRRLRDLRRAPRRRRLGGERAVREARGRGRPRPDALSPDLRSAASRRAGLRSSARR